MSNIITAEFGNSRAAKTRPIFEYNAKQILQFPDLDLPDVYEVHMCNEGDEETKTAIGNANGVQIYNEYLRTGRNVIAYIVLHAEPDSRETEYMAIIPIKYRPVDGDAPPDPEQEDYIGQIITELNNGVDRAEAAAEEAERHAEEAERQVEEAQRYVDAAADEADRAERAASRAESVQADVFAARDNAVEAAGRAVLAESNAAGSAILARGYAEQTARDKAAAEDAADRAAESAESAARSAESIEGDVEQAEEAARQAEAAKAAAEAARVAAEAAKDGAVTAKQGAEAAATNAGNSAGAAALSAQAAEAAKTAAAGSASDALAAKNAAELAQQKAEEEADNIAASAAQINQNTQDIADQKSIFEAHEQYAEETYAKQDGSYEDLTAGNAYELLSDRGDTNQQPYLYRKTGGDSSAYNREQLKKIVGGTVAWNQWMRNINDASQASNWGANNGTVAYSDGEIVFTPKADTSNKNFGQVTSASGVIVQGHKYLYSVIVTRSKAGANFVVAPRIGQTIAVGDIPAGVDYYINGVFEASAVSNLRFFFYPWGTSSFAADGTETVTVKSPMIIDLTQMFGTAIADYIYSLGQSTAGTGVAFFRSLFPADYYDYNPGELMSVEGVSAHIMRDGDNNIVGNYPLDSSLTLRGIPKLDSNNRLYYDGDTYEPDGTVNRRYGVVDLGTLNWTYIPDSAINFRSYENLGAKPAAAHNAVPNALCKAMPVIDYTAMSQGTEGLTIIFAQSAQAGRIWARNTSYTDAASFKAAMSGVMLVYELATPTTETAEPYREPEICDRDGTEEFVSTSIVPVGHETFYPVNVFDYIDQKIAALAAQIVNS